MGAGAAANLMYRGAGGQGAGGTTGGMADLLQDIGENLDGTECYLVMGALLAAASCSLSLCFAALIFFLGPRAHPSWWWLSGTFFIVFVVVLILLVEPRPQQGLPSLEVIGRTAARCDPREVRERVKRWWKWRTRYAAGQKTKLNV